MKILQYFVPSFIFLSFEPTKNNIKHGFVQIFHLKTHQIDMWTKRNLQCEPGSVPFSNVFVKNLQFQPFLLTKCLVFTFVIHFSLIFMSTINNKTSMTLSLFTCSVSSSGQDTVSQSGVHGLTPARTLFWRNDDYFVANTSAGASRDQQRFREQKLWPSSRDRLVEIDSAPF